ncbi:hypothetical protein [Yersinia phage fHe-Yen9-04]|uniref:Uncharacterized protein n=1 Tax=Yersinia phage fHe-Yen9-04 TaxID=2052742 RepID=A0A2C9CX72_9CAUD|nr:hypothetical protein FDJ41_gp133 [Yersinia phage fHe-Yen9-04]SOK58410.1 hypothetical protein [Yersinia phage fHe-Yen9-04]VUE36179.1 hypothetical protein [Yersinia phage fHe-Yen9-04]
MIHDKVNTLWGLRFNDSELLGYLPVFDEDHKAISYYSCENMHPEYEYRRVVPCYQYKVSEDWTAAEEDFFMQEHLPKKSRGYLVLQHEIYRDDYIKNFQDNKYVVIFVGCDDGDKVMRFKDRDSAINFLESITYYDEIFDDMRLMSNN